MEENDNGSAGKDAVKYLRLGILSTANVTKNIIPAIAASSCARITAVASRSLTNAEEFAAKNNIPKAYGTYEELLADPDVDIVYVPLPNKLHVEWVLKAAAAGKHVLCEKPLAITTEDLAAIASAAVSNRVIIAEAVMTLHLRQTRVVREMIREGKIGQVIAIRSSMHSIRIRDSYRNDSIANGGGSLWDVGCYPIFLTRYLLGEEPCEAIGRAVMSSDGSHDESFFGTLLFSDGKVALQLFSSFCAPTKMTYEIVGSRGVISLPNPFKATKVDKIELSQLQDDGVSQVITLVDPEETSPHVYSAEVDDLCRCIRGEGTPDELLVGAMFTQGTVRSIIALHESAKAGGIPAKISAPREVQ